MSTNMLTVGIAYDRYTGILFPFSRKKVYEVSVRDESSYLWKKVVLSHTWNCTTLVSCYASSWSLNDMKKRSPMLRRQHKSNLFTKSRYQFTHMHNMLKYIRIYTNNF